MMRLLLLAAAAAAAVTSPLGARAPEREAPLGTRIPVRMDERDIEEVRKVQHRFAQCVAAKHKDVAARFVLWQPADDADDRERRKLVRKVADGNCLYEAALDDPYRVQMTLPGDTMRYALADALVRSELGLVPLTGLEAVVRLQHPQLDEADYRPKPGSKVNPKKLQELAESRSRELARIYLSQFGECAVRADSAKARDLLVTEPASPEESAAFQRLVPVLGKCLDAGQSLALNKIIVRGTVAYNYYRLAKASRDPAAATATAAAK